MYNLISVQMKKINVVIFILLFSAAVLSVGSGGLNKNRKVKNQLKTNLKDEIMNCIGMKLKLIPAGSFFMGGELENEKPLHIVKITKPFYMGVYEVTREEYEKVMDLNPPGYKKSNLPAGNVTWNNAVEFCDKLSLISGEKYRLPTEAEWEYAARGGLRGKKYVWGDQEIPVVNGLKQANVPDESTLPDLDKDKIFLNYNDGYSGIAPVGSFAPNRFGLYDMAGNVWERCSDWYDDNYYKYSPQEDPKGPPTGIKRVLRSGGYWFHRNNLRLAYRCGTPLDRAGDNDGFRVVMEIK